jgi:hypothetical protein
LGALDTIGASDFDELYTLYSFDIRAPDNMIENSPVGTLAQMLLGDWGYVRNFENYGGDGAWEGENIVKLDENKLCGHGTVAATEDTLIAKLRLENTNKVNPGRFRKFEGNRNGFTNISRLGINVFDKRN